MSHFFGQKTAIFKVFLIMAYIALRIRLHFCQMESVISSYLTPLIYLCSSGHIKFQIFL